MSALSGRRQAGRADPGERCPHVQAPGASSEWTQDFSGFFCWGPARGKEGWLGAGRGHVAGEGARSSQQEPSRRSGTELKGRPGADLLRDSGRPRGTGGARSTSRPLATELGGSRVGPLGEGSPVQSWETYVSSLRRPCSVRAVALACTGARGLPLAVPSQQQRQGRPASPLLRVKRRAARGVPGKNGAVCPLLGFALKPGKAVGCPQPRWLPSAPWASRVVGETHPRLNLL